MRQNFAISSRNYENFEQAFFALLDKHDPYKNKKIRANQVPYMTENLGKAIMKRSQLKITLKLTQQKVCYYTRNKIIFVVSCIRKKERSTIAA